MIAEDVTSPSTLAYFLHITEFHGVLLKTSGSIAVGGRLYVSACLSYYKMPPPGVLSARDRWTAGI